MPSEFLAQGQMVQPAWEPKRQNRWILDWDGIDAWTLKTFARPSFESGEITIDYINSKRYFAGKFAWQTSAFTLQDPITPSASQKVMEWVRKIYENATGRAGYKEIYAAKNFKLKMLDPTGVVVEQWDYINAFPTTVNFEALDYANAEAVTCNVTIRFDLAILSF